MLRDCTTCGNCTWGNGLGPFPEICIKCRYVEEDGCKVPSNWKAKPKTNADRIRAMTDDELNDLFREIYDAGIEDAVAYEWGQRTNSFEWTMEWLQQPAEGD